MDKHAVVTMHGILTFGRTETWQDRLGAYLSLKVPNLRAYLFRYGLVLPIFSHMMTYSHYFSLPGIARDYYIRKLVSYLNNVYKDDPERHISVIAHSFGGWLLERAIPRLKFPLHSVIFVACPISAHVEHGYFYSYLETGRVRKVVSWSSHEDEIIGFIAGQPFGQNGYWGFIRNDHPEDRAAPARQPYPLINLINEHTREEHCGVLDNLGLYGPRLIANIIEP